LAAARRADDRHEVTFVDPQRHVADRGNLRAPIGIEIGLAEVFQRQALHDVTNPHRCPVARSMGARNQLSTMYQRMPSTIMPTTISSTDPARRASNIRNPMPLVPTMISAAISARQP